MEISGVQSRAIRPSNTQKSDAQGGADAKAVDSGHARKEDVQISSAAMEEADARREARILEQARAESGEKARARLEDRTEAQREARQAARTAEMNAREFVEPGKTLAVRFGPSPVQMGGEGLTSSDSALRDGLHQRSLPRVSELLQNSNERQAAAESPGVKGSPETEALPLPGSGSNSDQEELALRIIGDGEAEFTEAVQALSDANPEIEAQKSSTTLEPQQMVLPGSSESDAAKAAISGEANETREVQDLELGTDSADLLNASANASATGGAQNAKSEQLNRTELPGSGGGSDETAKLMGQAAASQVSTSEPMPEDSLITGHMDKSPGKESAA
ncbi:MAG: hypothetical protein GY725_08835 [bacterium]|nr:hypothetical protein [bacterium]